MATTTATQWETEVYKAALDAADAWIEKAAKHFTEPGSLRTLGIRDEQVTQDANLTRAQFVSHARAVYERNLPVAWDRDEYRQCADDAIEEMGQPDIGGRVLSAFA